MKLYINAMEGERVGVDEDNYNINGLWNKKIVGKISRKVKNT